MATRTVFEPLTEPPFYTETPVIFTWLEDSNKDRDILRKSVHNLHTAAHSKHQIGDILEASTAANQPLGKALSAFNLEFSTPKGKSISVEAAYQGSKVFQNGGAYHDIYSKTALQAKRDPRTKTSGKVVGFNFFGEQFPISPMTYFYNFLYINTLIRSNHNLLSEIVKYSGFTDIYYSERYGINCQARALAIAVGLNEKGLLDDTLNDRSKFLTLMKGAR